jgi:hypothetical protein
LTKAHHSLVNEEGFNADQMQVEKLRLFADLAGDGNTEKQWGKMVMLCREEAKYRAIWTVVFLCREHIDMCLSGMIGQIAVFRQYRHRKAAQNLHEMISIAQSYCRILHGQAPTPCFTPISGASFTTELQVTLEVPSKSKKHDAIGSDHKYSAYFTLDGTLPHVHSHEYNGPIQVTENTTIKVIVSAAGVENSKVVVAEYFRAMPVPRIEQVGCMISMHCDGPDHAEIRFTTCLSREEGEEPTFVSQLYSRPFVLGLPGTYTVRVLTCCRNCNPSPVATESVVISDEPSSSSGSTRPSNTSTLTATSVLSSEDSSDDLDFIAAVDRQVAGIPSDNQDIDNHLTILSTPEQPSVIHTTCSTLTIAWLPVDHATGYCLAWRTTGGESEEEVNYACGGQLISACSCVIGADAGSEDEDAALRDVLLPDSQYQVMVCAANEEQWSSWSAWSEVGQTFFQNETPQAPHCAQVLPLTSSALLMVLPMQNNCSGFVATFKQSDAPEEELLYANQENVIVEPVYLLGYSESEVLSPATPYITQLVAANGVGWSGWSDTSQPCSTLGSDSPVLEVPTSLPMEAPPLAIFLEVLDRTYSNFTDSESSPHPWIFDLAECLATSKESLQLHASPEMVHRFLSSTLNPQLYAATLRTSLLEMDLLTN